MRGRRHFEALPEALQDGPDKVGGVKGRERHEEQVKRVSQLALREEDEAECEVGCDAEGRDGRLKQWDIISFFFCF